MQFDEFDPSKWVLVGDTSEKTGCNAPHVDGNWKNCPTRQQIQHVKQNGISIHGAILCNTADAKNAEVCTELEYFPAFCNMETNLCVTGTRHTVADFEDLQRRSNVKKG